ncbi:NAD-dependent epimerase/dehydratase family protein [Streptomyces sp. LP11]|uniref:NAD-dependent epimerase/dehydratase family protein n=1 Tax=Streptomyces pyxinicus TaxID=2970331 RepID=A0ABT2AX64_9ACTN|nr:NAD-dependent epimerase/dehydratase family protein [Streptomyces sp. LP11]MCS0600847.1 NAD-dependent epimerase/dehydratase family protein [Streptomyces sp. LP11]
MNDFAGRRIVVTGASGFIGARVVERLVLDTGAEVRALVRGYGRAARLSVLPQERLTFQTVDLDDPRSLRKALHGGDLVVHCAFGSQGEVADRWRTTVEGTANLLAAAKLAGADRLVHLSTVDVYDTTGLTRFDETAPPLPENADDREYEQQKAAAERLVLAAHGDGPETVVLQPGVVYGPWGGQWTVAQLTRPAEEFEELAVTGAGGACNAVYVDDVVDAVLAALAEPAAAGRKFLVGGPDEPGWGEFFDRLREIRGLTAPAGTAARGAVPDWEQALYASPARVDAALAARVLTAPRTTLDDGMARTAEWARWAGYGAPGGASR